MYLKKSLFLHFIKLLLLKLTNFLRNFEADNYNLSMKEIEMDNLKKANSMQKIFKLRIYDLIDS